MKYKLPFSLIILLWGVSFLTVSGFAYLLGYKPDRGQEIVGGAFTLIGAAALTWRKWRF